LLRVPLQSCKVSAWSFYRTGDIALTDKGIGAAARIIENFTHAEYHEVISRQRVRRPGEATEDSSWPSDRSDGSGPGGTLEPSVKKRGTQTGKGQGQRNLLRCQPDHSRLSIPYASLIFTEA
jgi:hypothetical protein